MHYNCIKSWRMISIPHVVPHLVTEYNTCTANGQSKILHFILARVQFFHMKVTAVDVIIGTHNTNQWFENK